MAASWGSIGDGFFQDADGAGDHGQDIVEVVRDAARELADRIHLLRMPQLGFRGLLFGQVAADEEVAADRLRPRPGPVQRDRLALLVDIARLEIALALSPSRRPHLLAGVFEIVGVDEFHRAVSDHVGGLIAEDRGDARADLDEIPRGVGHQDEVVRGIEDAPPLLDFLAERLLRPLAFGDVARGLGDADDLAGGRADRGDAQRNVDGAAILAHARRLVMFDRLASADPFDDIAYLVAPVRRDDDVDALADRFRRREAEQAFGGSVPAGDGAVQQFGDDGVVG